MLVIGNALHTQNVDDWSLIERGRLPTTPNPAVSAFSRSEIAALGQWVDRGGSLLLLADHMPFAGAAAALGESFGFTFLDGFVEDPDTWDPTTFGRTDGALIDHVITRGRRPGTRVDSVATFDGQAFVAEGAEPLMILSRQYVSYQPSIPWDIDSDTPTVSVAGWLQGAVKRIGRGRMAVFGDATMFSAQIRVDGQPMGMNAPQGAQNLDLLLNVMHWLTD